MKICDFCGERNWQPKAVGKQFVCQCCNKPLPEGSAKPTIGQPYFLKDEVGRLQIGGNEVKRTRLSDEVPG